MKNVAEYIRAHAQGSIEIASIHKKANWMKGATEALYRKVATTGVATTPCCIAGITPTVVSAQNISNNYASYCVYRYKQGLSVASPRLNHIIFLILFGRYRPL